MAGIMFCVTIQAGTAERDARALGFQFQAPDLMTSTGSSFDAHGTTLCFVYQSSDRLSAAMCPTPVRRCGDGAEPEVWG